jgi:hypothetical protein
VCSYGVIGGKVAGGMTVTAFLNHSVAAAASESCQRVRS